MKKLLLYGLSLSLVFSLAACASKSAPSDAGKDNQTDDLTQAISNVKQSETKETLTNEELIKVFEEAYSIVLEVQGNDDYSIEIDYMTVEEIVDNLYPTKKLPADYKERYIEWRPLDDNTPDNQSNQLFTEVNETMYVTSTVNIRESYSVESTKLGTLSRGQSVTRIGIGISNSEADGWSKVILSDGREVYVSSDCLSATKPSTSSNSSNSSTKNNGTSGSESQQGNYGNTSGGSNHYSPDPKDLPGYTDHGDIIPVDPKDFKAGEKGTSTWG